MSEPVTVLFFGGAQDAAGARSASLEVPHDGCALSVFADHLVNSYPALGPYLALVRWAVNGTVVPSGADAARVKPGDEVALLPPFAGG
jgi:molybdopterin converting factor small subunit